jgi:hypothetical protein
MRYIILTLLLVLNSTYGAESVKIPEAVLASDYMKPLEVSTDSIHKQHEVVISQSCTKDYKTSLEYCHQVTIEN